MERPLVLNVLAGARSYKVQIWWEIRPRVAGSFLVEESFRDEGAEREERDELGRFSPSYVKFLEDCQFGKAVL